ncbi:glycoside hydrolase family 16 protein [Calocera cornea HHB12733]|uniref:Glycoside hydrolase family 16 protein n=1 Tax=Calocera cornea HHB12733 TaxID=1353952 RepID=A0A165GEG3_9BASI|nr:glycoside hydrolase family 16 protein [Calocera cornea HHB12733]
MLAALSAVALALAGTAVATTYNIHDTFIGSEFLSGFTWEAIADPTNGRVNYVSQATALADNLTYTSSDTFIMRADYTTTLTASGPGRNSVRIQSNNAYTYALMVLDLRHMPEGCATWPAFWTTGATDWPTCGEIDIIEGVNNEVPNLTSLHTSAGCTMPATGRTMMGTSASTDCNANDNGNQGCGVDSSFSNSFGPPFNSNGGGIYAMERTSTSISVWFWPRNSGLAPAAVTSGASSLDTSTFGEPDALFVDTDCDIPSHFTAHNIIFDLTLCGDWAGNAYPSTCPSDCIDYVNNNPADFENAYWDVASLRVYE